MEIFIGIGVVFVLLLLSCLSKNLKSRKPDTRSFQGQSLLHTLDIGIEIGLDLAKFSAQKRRGTNELAEEEFEAECKNEMRLQSQYISSNPWPSELLILDFIHNKNGRFTHRTQMIKKYGPKYYNHSLAKELYNAGSLMDNVTQRTQQRRVGWKIKAYGESISGKRDEEEILRCMQTYYYILNHVICGGDILPLPQTQKSMHPIMVMTKLIEFAWDDIGLWKA